MTNCSIICAYNEEKTIKEVVKQMISAEIPLIVIDNNSSDKTSEVLQPYQDRIVLLYESRLGKSHALRKGIQYALTQNYDKIITMDGDGEHKPSDMVEMLETHDQQGNDITIGNRFDQSKGL